MLVGATVAVRVAVPFPTTVAVVPATEITLVLLLEKVIAPLDVEVAVNENVLPEA